MNNCQKYLEKQKSGSCLAVLEYTPITVVIPCYDEPTMVQTLESLWACENYDKNLHVIVVLNHEKNSPKKCIAQNKKTSEELAEFKQKHSIEKRKLSVIEVVFAENSGGVGEARKIGMDEVVRQCVEHQKNGIIASLDADTLCAKNYLAELYRHFTENSKANAAIINYEHQLEGLSESHKEAIIQYELYLRYMTLAYRYVEHPNAFHTIGSTFAVRTSAYCKQAGMSRRQAGEDFYFLQKILSLGKCSELNATCVYPSARTSERVPFGTGKAVHDLMQSSQELQTYSFKAFQELKAFFDLHKKLYKISKNDFEHIVYNDLGGLIKSWLIDVDFYTEIEKINGNCASLEMFSKKFFESFSIFQIIKYLNFSHTHFLQKVGIFHSVSCLPEAEHFDFTDTETLLSSLRKQLRKTTFVKK